MRTLAVLAGWKGYALTGGLCLTLGVTAGWTVRDWKAQADTAADRIAAAAAQRVAIASALTLERAQADTTSVVEREAVAEQVRIRTVTETIIKEVPIYVTAEADARFALPVGLVRLHDAAATGRPLSESAGEPDGAAGNAEASDVPASTLAAMIAENYGVCLADQARFSGLQDWVRRQQALMNGP